MISPMILLLVLIILYLKFRKIIYLFMRLNELPRKKGYLFIGNLLEFTGSPESVFRSINLYINQYSCGGVVMLWLSALPLVIITDPDVVEEVISHQNSEKGFIYNLFRPWLNDGLLISSGAKWHARRKMLTSAFHFNILQKFLHTFNEESKCMVESLKTFENQEIDISPIISRFTLDTICETAMGINAISQTEDGEKYCKSINEFGILALKRVYKPWLFLNSLFRLSKNYWKQKELLKILHGFTDQVIKTRKQNVHNNFELKTADDEMHFGKNKMGMLDLLISSQKRGENIDDEGIREEVDTFVFEGHDTTSVSLSFTIMLLANNRICQEKINEELKSIFEDDDRDPTNADLQKMKYLECCIKESLRLYPSVPKISRILKDDIILKSGCTIPKDSIVVIAVYEMHRRPDLYPNPEEFIPERFLLENTQNKHPFAFIPFSAGSRNCIGQKFAMMEMKCLLSSVLRKYIIEPVDKPEDIECMIEMVLRPKRSIRVKLTPRGNKEF